MKTVTATILPAPEIPTMSIRLQDQWFALLLGENVDPLAIFPNLQDAENYRDSRAAVNRLTPHNYSIVAFNMEDAA